MTQRSVRILVVDDERHTRNYIARILTDRAWEVDTAADGPTALEMAERTTYDAVVLDYRMPGMDGAELCRRIREVQPDVREVFLTGYPTLDTVYPAIDAGAERVLAKPVNAHELITVLEQQIAIG